VLDAVWTELRVSARTLRNAPSFAAAAALTVALGIGASTAIFSVVYGILLRPLPYRDVDRVVVVAAERDYSGRARPEPTSFGLADVVEWQSRTQTLDSVAFMGGNSYSLADADGARTIDAADVTTSFFATLGGPMALGRGFADGDSAVVVISHGFWQTRFGGSPSALGATLTLNGRSYAIVGVAGADFQMPTAQKDVWVLAPPPSNPNPARRGVGGFTPLGRLKPGVTTAQASGDAQRVIDSLNRDFPSRYDHIRASVQPLRDRVLGSIRPALLMLLASVALLLFVACANVANLMLGRNLNRAREFAVRSALGASRGRLAARSIADAAVLSSVGSALGVFVAALLVRAAARFAPLDTPRLNAVRLDWPVLIFAAASAAITALAAGLLPALGRRPAADQLRSSGGSTSAGPSHSRAGSALIVAELAISIVLLVGATLLTRSLWRLMHTDIGVSTDHVAAARIDLAYGRSVAPDQQIAMIDNLVARIGALPGVTEAAATASLPPNAAGIRITMTQVDEADRPMANFLVDAVTATPRFFSMLHVPLLQGRFFTDADDTDHPPVMIMSEDTVRMLFKERNPIGRTLTLPSTIRRTETVTLVGIIGNIKYSGLDVAPNGAIYRPYAQAPWPSMFLLARTSGDPSGVARSLASAVAEVDRGITFARANTLDGMVADAVSQPRFRTALLGSCAVLALVLAAAGLYGVVAYGVSRRTTEIGIRMALGADRGAVVAMVLGEGARLAAAGIVIGVAASLALSRLLSGLLYGVAPTDPLSFVAAVAALFAIALVSSYLPARRAARVDPMIALRAE
jgi:putative ABC transport system permease protein